MEKQFEIKSFKRIFPSLPNDWRVQEDKVLMFFDRKTLFSEKRLLYLGIYYINNKMVHNGKVRWNNIHTTEYIIHGDGKGWKTTIFKPVIEEEALHKTPADLQETDGYQTNHSQCFWSRSSAQNHDLPDTNQIILLLPRKLGKYDLDFFAASIENFWRKAHFSTGTKATDIPGHLYRRTREDNLLHQRDEYLRKKSWWGFN